MFLRVSILPSNIHIIELFCIVTCNCKNKHNDILRVFGFQKWFDIMYLTAIYCKVDFLCESIPVKLLSTDTKFMVVRVNVRTTIRFFRVFSRQSVTYIHIQTYTRKCMHPSLCNITLQNLVQANTALCFEGDFLVFVTKRIEND